jgi:hypothetical protein
LRERRKKDVTVEREKTKNVTDRMKRDVTERDVTEKTKNVTDRMKRDVTERERE